MLLCTMHQDNILRLWNIDDGRCIGNSSPTLLHSNGVHLKAIRGFPGHVLLFSELADIFVVNVYTMQVVSHTCMNFKGFIKSKYDPIQSSLQICDENGAIKVYMDAKANQNDKFKIDEYTSDRKPKKLD